LSIIPRNLLEIMMTNFISHKLMGKCVVQEAVFCTDRIKELKSEMAEKEMHKAVCAECGKECEVPFKPDPSRPVYCRDCWSKKRNTRRRF
jgi:CxxC-x17-CxxC domain-containing protein